MLQYTDTDRYSIVDSQSQSTRYIEFISNIECKMTQNLPRTLWRPGFLPRGEVESLQAGDGGVTQAVEVDAVPVVGVGGHVWHGVTRVPAPPALTRVQALAGAVSPKLDGAAIIENISIM